MAAVVIAAIAITLVVMLGGDDGKPGPASAGQRDISSPEAAAESFAAAVKGGNASEVLALTCVGDNGCVDKLAADSDNEVTPEKIDKAQETIKKGVSGLAKQLDGAEFDKPRDASTPGAREVPYRTPRSPDATYYLIFLESGGNWFYLGGGASHSAPPANQPSPAR